MSAKIQNSTPGVERADIVRSAPVRLTGDCNEVEVDVKCDEITVNAIPEVLRKQGSASNCSATAENVCPCNTMEAIEQMSKEIQFCNRKSWVTIDRMTELRKKAQDAVKIHKTFTIRGCFFSVRNALTTRGWVEKLDVHRKHIPSGVCQVTYEDLSQGLPKRKPGETRRQYLIKCERNIMSRFLEHMPIDFLWTARKEKCDYIDQAKNPTMIINKFHRVPFTSKEGLCNQLKDFHWYYEEGMSELYFPRCFNVWSPEELSDFVDNFKMTSCMSFLRWLVDKFIATGFDAVFSPTGKIPFTAIEFALKRCNEFIDACNHNDIDSEEQIRIWEHDWDAFLTQHYLLTTEGGRILSDPHRLVDPIVKAAEKVLDGIRPFWPQFALDGYLNLWIVKPANKCRGRGIHLMDNLKKILNTVNPAISSKSRFVVQKYIERPLIIHSTKFDIRQWFLVTSTQPLIVWMYKESYLRFSSQEYNLTSHHESVHLTNHAIQKKYRNGKRDKRLPNENMWDCYSFQAYLRQIGQHDMWTGRIYPGMQRAIIGTMLASQDNMDRRTNTFELFGADFMISEDFYPWLIEINSSPDLGATTSVTARMCPQCLEDAIKVVIDRRSDPKADTGNFELIYRQTIPPTPAYMGLNLFLKGKQISTKANNQHNHHSRRDRYTINPYKYSTHSHYHGTSMTVASSSNLTPMPTFQATEFLDSLDPKSPRHRQLTLKTASLSPSSLSSNFSNSTQNLSSSRQLLTPLYTSSSPRDQLLKSPFRRRSNEILWKSKSPRSDQLLPQNTSRRHLSCGPRLVVSEEQPVKQEQNSKMSDKPNTRQNKLKSLHPTVPKTPPNSANLPNRKHILELIGKSKSGRKSSGKASKKNKPSPMNSNVLSTGNRRNYLNSVKKLGNFDKAYVRHGKTCKGIASNGKAGNAKQTGSPFHAVGKGLKTWKSREYKMWKEADGPITTHTILGCKSTSEV